MSERTPKEYLSRQELAELTGFSPATIQRLKERGLIPFHQPGGQGSRVIFPRDALERRQPEGAADAGSAPEARHAQGKLSGPRARWRQSRNSRVPTRRS